MSSPLDLGGDLICALRSSYGSLFSLSSPLDLGGLPAAGRGSNLESSFFNEPPAVSYEL